MTLFSVKLHTMLQHIFIDNILLLIYVFSHYVCVWSLVCNCKHIFFAENWLLVGTKPGHLLLYRIKKDAGWVYLLLNTS